MALLRAVLNERLAAEGELAHLWQAAAGVPRYARDRAAAPRD
jgi:hypothetical protein